MKRMRERLDHGDAVRRWRGALLLGAAGPALAQPDRLLPPCRSAGRAGAGVRGASAGRRSAAPAPAPPKEWTGESGSSGHPQMQAERHPQAAAQFRILRRRPVAARRQAQHLARELRQIHRRADAGSAHHGSGGRPAGVHQGVLGLSRHPGERRAHRRAAAKSSPRTRRSSTRSRSSTASTAISSPRSGASSRTTARSAATGRCCARPRRWPASAAARPISATNFCPRWKSCIAAICKPEQLIGSWAGAFGPTQFMPTSFKRYAVDFDGDGRRDVVSSAADLIASTANNLKKDGWVPGETWGYEVVVPKGFNYLLADRSQAAHARRMGSARHHARRQQAVPAVCTRRPICWCRPAIRVRAS